MDTKSIVLTVGHQGSDDWWEEQWLGYVPTLTEEEACEEVEEVLEKFNGKLRQGEQPREAISFVLGPVVEYQ